MHCSDKSTPHYGTEGQIENRSCREKRLQRERKQMKTITVERCMTYFGTNLNCSTNLSELLKWVNSGKPLFLKYVLHKHCGALPYHRESRDGHAWKGCQIQKLISYI
ncbi:hypothetical protein AMECASPLE_010634 [Ameca splendens]|uniref:Uncharacterized protein n=1 Tax=Ameca splendens TaxID=208324 RepID=A0ABV1A884_9TELE